MQNESTSTINVYPRPTGIQMDNLGNIWVMCSGRAAYHPGGFSPSYLICIDTSSNEIIKEFPINSLDTQAQKLEINAERTTLYYLFNENIYKFLTTSNELESSHFITRSWMACFTSGTCRPPSCSTVSRMWAPVNPQYSAGTRCTWPYLRLARSFSWKPRVARCASRLSREML